VLHPGPADTVKLVRRQWGGGGMELTPLRNSEPELCDEVSSLFPEEGSLRLFPLWRTMNRSFVLLFSSRGFDQEG
jgi:hypothetical protein